MRTVELTEASEDPVVVIPGALLVINWNPSKPTDPARRVIAYNVTAVKSDVMDTCSIH